MAYDDTLLIQPRALPFSVKDSLFLLLSFIDYLYYMEGSSDSI